MTEAEEIRLRLSAKNSELVAQNAKLQMRCTKLQKMYDDSQRFIETLRQENERLKRSPADAIFKGLD